MSFDAVSLAFLIYPSWKGANVPEMSSSAGTPGAQPDELMVASARHAWWVGLIVGLLSIAGGIVAIVYPGPTLKVIAILLGIGS